MQKRGKKSFSFNFKKIKKHTIILLFCFTSLHLSINGMFLLFSSSSFFWSLEFTKHFYTLYFNWYRLLFKKNTQIIRSAKSRGQIVNLNINVESEIPIFFNSRVVKSNYVLVKKIVFSIENFFRKSIKNEIVILIIKKCIHKKQTNTENKLSY